MRAARAVGNNSGHNWGMSTGKRFLEQVTGAAQRLSYHLQERRRTSSRPTESVQRSGSDFGSTKTGSAGDADPLKTAGSSGFRSRSRQATREQAVSPMPTTPPPPPVPAGEPVDTTRLGTGSRVVAYRTPSRSQRIRGHANEWEFSTVNHFAHHRHSEVARSSVPKWLRDSGITAWAIIGIAIVVGGIVFGTSKILPVFVALFVALVFTALLTPVVNWLDRWLNRWVATILALLAALAIFTGLVSFVIASVAGQWPSLTRQFGNGLDKILDLLDRTPFKVDITAEEVVRWINEVFASAVDYVQENWSTLASEVLSNVSSVGMFFTIAALAIFVTIFCLGSGVQMWRWFLNLLPAHLRSATHRAAAAGWQSFSGYSRGTLIIAFLDGVMAWIYLQIVGVPLAPALGVLVMIGALIPLFGAPLAMLVAMVVALAVDGVVKAAIVGVGIALIGQFEGHVLQPLIMGHQASLHPVVVGVGVAAGTLVAGLLGAIVAIPIIGVIWAVFTELYHHDPPLTEAEFEQLKASPNSSS